MSDAERPSPVVGLFSGMEAARRRSRLPLSDRPLPWGFLLVVALPTLAAAVYFLLIASPRYVSEARFIVRAGTRPPPTSVGLALQGAGLASAQTDAFAVHDWMRSRDAVVELRDAGRLEAVLGAPGADPVSRWPRLGEGRTVEGLHRAYRRFVTVGYDSTTGISVLRVEAYRSEDARRLAENLLQGGERLVNRLNVRAAADAVTEAARAVDEAEARLAMASSRLTGFRNRQRFIDPQGAAEAGGQVIVALTTQLATLRADRAQLAAEAPQSPQLPSLDGRIRALERQISAERARIAGAADSLAPQVSAYEDLVLERQFADRQLAEATSALIEARQEARRQSLYLERVAGPLAADEATRPRRWRSILIVLFSTLLIWGVGRLLILGLREHRQAA
ncbi:chain-length determining protein [Brevundimonas sp.]|jgi:BexC/CtrB/KpsE family polysaccharide export inner-membrane protein|uniref:chain-length determining protein n=1 Tax=Brevundimonas sp. TaxID=1871086 RepID=UPI002E118215|nr:chain-length determining protein [Brevundimonas sp.]